MKDIVFIEDGDTTTVLVRVDALVDIREPSEEGRVLLHVDSKRIHILTDKAMSSLRQQVTIPEMCKVSLLKILKWKLQLATRGHISAKDVQERGLR